MAQPIESNLKMADGTPLFVADWRPEPSQAVVGGVVLMHGLGEHGGRYPHVARFFNQRGLLVRTYDHRGHGRSGGARGDVPGQQTALQDAKIVIDDFARQLPERSGAPLLFGHSMGGLFAARFACGGLSPLQALILSSPALALPLSGVQKFLLKVLSAVAPGLGIYNGLKTQYLSHDPAVEMAYNKDPLVHPRISARLLNSMRAAVEFAQSHATALSIPTLLVYAGQDRLVDARGSEQFSAHFAPGVGTVHRYDDFYHEIFNEVNADRVFADVDTWLNRNVLKTASRMAPATSGQLF